MPRPLVDGGRDELEAVIQVVLDAIAESDEDPTFFTMACQGALDIAGSLGMFCQCTKEHSYLQSLLDGAVLTLEQAGKRFRGPCTHGVNHEL